MRRTIGWLWMLGTGVVVVDCGGQTTLTVEQPQPSGDAGAGGATNVTGGAAGATGGSGGLEGSTPVNTDAADADAALMCDDLDATPPTLCIDGEVWVFSGYTGQGGCERVPAGCVIESQACANQMCGGGWNFGRWCNDRAVACFKYGQFY